MCTTCLSAPSRCWNCHLVMQKHASCDEYVSGFINPCNMSLKLGGAQLWNRSATSATQMISNWRQCSMVLLALVLQHLCESRLYIECHPKAYPNTPSEQKPPRTNPLMYCTILKKLDTPSEQKRSRTCVCISWTTFQIGPLVQIFR